MSRIGKLPITIPSGVTVSIEGNTVTVTGPKGTLSQSVDPRIVLKLEDNTLELHRKSDSIAEKSLHGLYRSLVNNMVVGVSEGYTRTLELIGVGFRASNTGQLLELTIGYSHPVFIMLPPEVSVETKMERNKAPIVILSSADKQLLGQVCAKIRSLRKPEPYKGKGIKFQDEFIRRKSGKAAAK